MMSENYGVVQEELNKLKKSGAQVSSEAMEAALWLAAEYHDAALAKQLFEELQFTNLKLTSNIAKYLYQVRTVSAHTAHRTRTAHSAQRTAHNAHHIAHSA
jgi:hypothetical protein